MSTIFDSAWPYEVLPESDPYLKACLNYNPPHNLYTKKQNFPGRSPDETDRGGWRGYDRVYSHYLTEKKLDKFNFLEIGIHYGYGVLAWCRYLEHASISGVDNDSNDKYLIEMEMIKEEWPPFRRAKLFYFDTTTADGWMSLNSKRFDVIIDDGGHHPSTQVATLKYAWEYLNPGGLYFIEDIGHRYGEENLGTLSDRIVELKKQGHLVQIYKHHNAGLEHILKSDKLRKNYRINASSKTKATEYIACIHKL